MNLAPEMGELPFRVSLLADDGLSLLAGLHLLFPLAQLVGRVVRLSLLLVDVDRQLLNLQNKVQNF